MRRAAIAALLATVGCAHMDVEVAIFDAAHWSSPEYADELAAANLVSAVVDVREGKLDRRRNALKARVARALDKALAASEVASESVGPLKESFAKTVDDACDRARTGIEQAFSLLTRARRDQNVDRAMFDAALRAFAATTASLSELEPRLAKDLPGILGESDARDGKSGAREAARRKVKETLVAEVSEAVRGEARISPESGLLEDPRASTVLYAPEERWQRTINETICEGTLGNTDCAVKMDAIANFTIKGVRLDASKITQATFSAGTEAIRIVAALTGAPLPAQSGKESAIETASFQAPVTREREASFELLKLRLARLAILDAVLAERRAIEGKDVQLRDRAVASIKTTFEAYRRQLAGGAGKPGDKDAP